MRDRENREREIMEYATQQEERVKIEAEQRDRELRERQQQQQQEQAAHDNHAAPIQIHQPVAVAPSTRTIHGPNGLLGQSGSLGGPSIPGPGAPNPMFGVAAVQAVQPAETTPRMQHAVPPPPPQSSMLMPFPGPPGPGAMAIGQGQQPILNVSDTLGVLDRGRC